MIYKEYRLLRDPPR